MEILFLVLIARFEVWEGVRGCEGMTTLDVLMPVSEEDVCICCGGRGETEEPEEPEEREDLGGGRGAEDDPPGCGEEGEV